mgnify:CR=1 FL=1
MITSVDFDTLDYSSDELLNITITIKYDYAILEDVISDYSNPSASNDTKLWNLNKPVGGEGRVAGGFGGDNTVTPSNLDV